MKSLGIKQRRKRPSTRTGALAREDRAACVDKKRACLRNFGAGPQSRIREDLEADLHRELQDARIASGEHLVVIGVRQTRCRSDDRIGVVEGVETLEPELAFEPFAELDVLEQRQVRTPEAGQTNRARSAVRERGLRHVSNASTRYARCGRRECGARWIERQSWADKRCPVEPRRVLVWLVGVWIADLVRAQHAG